MTSFRKTDNLAGPDLSETAERYGRRPSTDRCDATYDDRRMTTESETLLVYWEGITGEWQHTYVGKGLI